MRKIFLVGYMGSGKTTIGRRLAEKMNMHFVDLDLFIENRYRKNVRDIFTEKGEASFREIENNALKEVACFENVLVSTGGGTPCFFNNMEFMNSVGTTIYLKVSEEELANRLNLAKQNRPLIQNKTKEELMVYIHDSLIQRESFYNQSSITIGSCHLDTVQDVDSIVEELSIYLK